MQTDHDVTEYLRRPYARQVVPEDDGTYRGEILEFPGCITTGDTAVEALASLEEVAASWLRSALSNNQPIPKPIELSDFSGRFVLRLPRSLHKRASIAAERDGSSLNQFITMAVAERVGEVSQRSPQATQLINLFAQQNITQNTWHGTQRTWFGQSTNVVHFVHSDFGSTSIAALSNPMNTIFMGELPNG